MENKIYLIREIYDSFSYNLYDELEGFINNNNSVLVGCRRAGKTTIAVIDALSEALLKDNIRIGFYTDNGTNRIKLRFLKEACDSLNIDYSIDPMNCTIILSNGSSIKVINKDQSRGYSFDYVIADVCSLTEFDYNNIVSISCRYLNFKIITGTNNSFTNQYKEDNPNRVFILDWRNLDVFNNLGEWY
jgi:hypothetical protein